MSRTVELAGGDSGEFARPDERPEPGVVVVGSALPDLVDRLAAEGFLALRVEVEALAAGVAYLLGRDECTGRIGALGLGPAAATVLAAPAHLAGLTAVVAFGPDDAAERYGRVTALVHVAHEDGGSDAAVVRAAVRGIEAAGGSVSVRDYAGTRSGFWDEARTEAFDQMQADEAWGATFDFLAEELRES